MALVVFVVALGTALVALSGIFCVVGLIGAFMLSMLNQIISMLRKVA